MAAKHTLGALQPDGRHVVEPTFDPVHVAQTVVHIAGLPNSVTVLDINIMCVIFSVDSFFAGSSLLCASLGRLGYLMLDADEFYIPGVVDDVPLSLMSETPGYLAVDLVSCNTNVHI